MVKRTEFICVGCWGTFEPHGNAEGDVICPHCGARQEVPDEPIDMDPEEFVDLEALPDVAQDLPADVDADEPVAPDDEDFNAVVEIDLDDLDDDEFAGAEYDAAEAESTDAAPDLGPRAGEDVADDYDAQGDEEGSPSRHWYLRTNRGAVYAFLTAELLVRWARRLSRKPASLLVSTDEAEWQPLPLFVSTLAEAGGLPEDLSEVVDALAGEGPGAVSDAELEKSLLAEAASYGDEQEGEEGVAPRPEAADGEAWPGGTAPASERPPTPTPVVEASAQRVGDFTFKVLEVTESAGGRYVILLLAGLVLGAGGALALAWLGVLPPFPL